MIIKLQNGNILKLSKEESDYLNWRKLSPEQKRQIRINKAKAYLNSGPNITNFWEAFQTYIGNRDPENPNLNTGEAPSPGWGKQGVTGLHKMIAKLPEAKQTLLAPLAGRSRAAAIIKDKNIVEAQKHRDEVYRRWASLYKQEHDPTPTTFRTNPAKIKRQESNVANSNARTLAGGKANAGGSYSSKSHTIRVTTSNNVSAKNLEDIAFHEGIHSYGLGESPSYVWKSKYLNFPEGTNPYFLDPKEIATHGIQQGQNLGIKVGQAYPGKEAMIKMIENRPEGQGFGGVPMILYNNAKTNSDYRRLWSLLNGTFKNGGVIKAANARKWKHEKGGKAFVTGVNILDSNPDAYKYVKKKYKMRSAQQGTKMSFGQKAGNFLNSDSGKGLLSLGTQIFGGLKTGSDIADFSNSFDQATDSSVKAMDSKMRATSYQKGLQKAKEFIAQKQLENPDVRYGEIDLMKMAQDFSNEFYDTEAIENYKMQRAQEKLQSMQAIQGSASSGFSDILQSGLGTVGNLLNSKKPATNTTTTNTITTTSNTPGGSLNNFNFGIKSKYFGTL